MNYFIISPNVWGDGNVEPHVEFMTRNHLVCMGWDIDRKHGWAFSEKIQMGDRVIVAQRRNWKWTVYFAGVIDGPAKYAETNGQHYTMCRDLRAFVDLRGRNGVVEFPEGMSGYARRNPGALFQLNGGNEADKRLITSIETLLHEADSKLSFSVREISNWGSNGRVAIPSLQRGLVWNPNQVELLWDSILRGFPIGSFVFSNATQESNQRTANTHADVQYFLLDGQQRANAIALAFERGCQGTRLWVDLLPVLPITRRFMVKATTKAHPWGYKSDNDSSILSASEIRNAICRFTGKPVNEIKHFDVSELDPVSGSWPTWPVESNCPIPLHRIFDFFDFYGFSAEQFEQAIVGWLNSDDNTFGKHPTAAEEPQLKEEIQKWYWALHGLTEYRIHANLLQQKLIEIEAGDSRVDEVSNLESLFTRLNTMGTRISPYDLRYSAIKAYWGEVKEENERVAQTIMPGANLAIFAFRLALTIAAAEYKMPERSVRLADVPSVARIRKLGIGAELDRVEERARSIILEELYKGRLQQIVDNIETALGVFKKTKLNFDGLPPFLRTSIISSSPDVYLFLMVLAYKNELSNFRPGAIPALSTYIHWMSVASKKNIVDALFAYLNENGATEENLRCALLKEVGSNIFPLVQLQLIIDENGQRPLLWRQVQHASFYDCLAYNKELLIFAERQYFNKTFKYDPSQMDLNKGHNKPWDYDHIVPKEWTSNKKAGEYRHICKYWTWTIGNFAAIPFSINRVKSNKEEWAEYLENAEELLFEKEVSQLERWSLVRVKEKASLFWRITETRLERIYSLWRNFVHEKLDLPQDMEIHEATEEDQ